VPPTVCACEYGRLSGQNAIELWLIAGELMLGPVGKERVGTRQNVLRVLVPSSSLGTVWVKASCDHVGGLCSDRASPGVAFSSKSFLFLAAATLLLRDAPWTNQ